MWNSDNRHRRLVIEALPKRGLECLSEEDSAFWKNLQFPVTVQESGPVDFIHICPQKPHWVALTGSLKVQIFDPESDSLLKTLSKGKERVYGAKFRDENTLGLGTDTGAVKVYSVATKTLLRDLKDGHNAPVHRVAFLGDKKHVASFSDDKSTILWDIPSGEIIFRGSHDDYVRSGDVSPSSSSLYASGSYDHRVKLWDKRQSSPVVVVDHGCPVEDILFLKGGSLLASGGGHYLQLWDLSAGKSLAKVSPHSKTITSLSTSNGGTRIVSSSLDRRVVFTDIISTFNPVYSLYAPSPLLRVAVAPDDTTICTGSTDGLVQFLHRRLSQETEADRLNAKTKRFEKVFHKPRFTPSEGDVVVADENIGLEKEAKHDYYFRKFEYNKALDSVLRPYVQNKKPQDTLAVLKELKRRQALKRTLAGRDDKFLGLIFQFISKYINKIEYSDIVLDVLDITTSLYGDRFGESPALNKAFLLIRKRVQREAYNIKSLMGLKGCLDMIISAADTAEPKLRYEEKEFQNAHKGRTDCKLSKVPLAWEKILFDV